MVAIIDYKAGNIRSVVNALDRIGVSAILTADPEEVVQASHVIFPGVGEAGSAMQDLKRTGMDEAIRTIRQPFLGICLGMQLLCAFSEEQNTEALGILPLRVRRFPTGEKVPHMGWNRIQVETVEMTNTIKENVARGVADTLTKSATNRLSDPIAHSKRLPAHPLFTGIQPEDDFYFVHSYAAEIGQGTIASTDYILPFSSAVQRDNFFGVQFHPEKSSEPGEQILRNFLSL